MCIRDSNNRKGAAWADVRYFGITADADTDEAKKFIEYSMSEGYTCLLYTSPSPRDLSTSRMPSSA